MSVDIKQSTGSPSAKDQGNIEIQGRVVSKTIKMGLFTENRNAVWAGRQQLRKASYPFAILKFPVNRTGFRYEVGDVFPFKYPPYGINEPMALRMLLKEEESPESERITVTAMEDIFSVASAVDDFTEEEDYTQPPDGFLALPFLHQTAVEAPYALRQSLEVVPIACRRSNNDMGMLVYLSIDGGSSYTLLDDARNICPHGAVSVAAYPADTYKIDDYAGFYVDIDQAGEGDKMETVTWAEVLAGSKNNALLGNEIITFQTVTPVTATRFKLENIIRGRFDTVRADHAIGEAFWFLGGEIDSVANAQILPGSTRLFKLVPYNARTAGDVSQAGAVSLAITGRAATPYMPGNLAANGESYASRYNEDIVLTWSPRYRGKGAGLGIPGEVISDSSREGLFKIEVWAGGALQRTVLGIDDVTWIYTFAMNQADNGALAHEVLFKVSNYLTVNGVLYESDQAEVTCYRNPGLAS